MTTDKLYYSDLWLLEIMNKIKKTGCSVVISGRIDHLSRQIKVFMPLGQTLAQVKKKAKRAQKKNYQQACMKAICIHGAKISPQTQLRGSGRKKPPK